MDEEIKELIAELEKAINASLTDSGRIADVIGKIKQAGYDVFLVLQQTIGFEKREDGDASETPPANDDAIGKSGGEIRLTTQDLRFLQILKISVEGEP